VASRAPVTPLHRLRLFFIFFYFSNLFPIYTKRRFVVVFAPMEQLMCIALAIYFEARGESSLGQWAVGNVVLNRVRDPRYPSDACLVVKQGPWSAGLPIRHKCQFSFYCDGKPEWVFDDRAWMKAVRMAGMSYTLDVVGGATHYHTHKVSPDWSAEMRLTRVVGNHLFFK
jgi:spore germination cell wall hydrolase CwlJ-like protein